jgi:hypothetical protein
MTGEPDQLMVVLHVQDDVNESLTGHAGPCYASPPQPPEQAHALVQVLLGHPVEGHPDVMRWTCPIAGGRRVITLAAAKGGER